MQIPSDTSAPAGTIWPSKELLGMTLRELRAWSGPAACSVIEPESDEAAWEGTEIDVHRTVL